MIPSMFGSLGFPELIFIFLLALLIFGPKKLPELGRTLGKAMAEFRKATTDLKRTINAELIEQELREADPRKMVRDSLREAKASLENAVRQDDAKAVAKAAVPVAAAAATAAGEPDEEAEAGVAPAEPAAANPAASSDDFSPAGAVARGAASAAEEPADPPSSDTASSDTVSSDPASSDPAPNAPQPATSS
jgi:TatA/E family protein of Tat protein translocase